MSRPFQLFRLQQIDSRIDWLNRRLEEIDRALKDDRELRIAAENAQEAKRKQEAARKALQQAEQSVQGQNIKIEQSEATLYSGRVQNPKELQDLQNEVAALKRYLEVLEERQLMAMLAEEEASEEQEAAAEKYDSAHKRFMQNNQQLIEEQAKLQKDEQRVQGERQAAESAIPASDLKIYQNLRANRRGIAVAKVTDKACSACGSTLNAALLHAARSPNDINHCDMCGRILYAG